MRRRGASGPSFPSIVASGEHGALPHAEPRDAEIRPGVLVTLDLGAVVDGYCSDCTRTWATGELDDDLAAIYDLVLRAQEAALGAVRAGPTGREVDAVARDLIAAEGHGEHFGHGLGHGVGLEVHEGPRLAPIGHGAAGGGQCGDRRARRLRPGARRRADRGSRRRHRGRLRRAERHVEGAGHRRLNPPGVRVPADRGKMTSLARIRPSLRRAAFVAALGALMVPATAGAAVHAEASAKKKKQAPRRDARDADACLDRAEARDPRPLVPSRAQQEHGRVQAHGWQGRLREGRRRHHQAAAADRAHEAQRRAGHAQRRSVPTRFRLRVLAKKFGKRFTKALALTDRRPRAAADPGGRPSARPPTATATASVKNGVETDDDGDLLDDNTELSYKIDPARPTRTATASPTATRSSRRATSTTTSTRSPRASCPTRRSALSECAVRGLGHRLRRRLADARRGVRALAGLPRPRGPRPADLLRRQPVLAL